MPRPRTMLAAAFTLLLSITLVAHANDYDEWLRWAELGPYQPAVEDWDAIYQRALEEPPLLVYAHTSRIFSAVEELAAEYPGLSVEALDMPGQEIIERVVREWDAGRRDIGVAFMALPWLQHDLLLPRQAVTRYVPRELEAQIDPSDTEPLLKHRFSASGWMYNDANFDQAPWDNIWELTTEKFRNRVVISDIQGGATTPTYFTGMIQFSDEMERLYEEFFSEPITLHTTTANAGEEFIRRLLQNDMRVLTSSREVAEALTNSTGPFAGMTVYSRLREVEQGTYRFAIDAVNSPVVVAYHYISIGSFTQSPNTAKLLIRRLTSQEGGRWFWGENFPVNSSYTLIEPFKMTLDDFELAWRIDANTATDVMDRLMDYWQLWR